MSYKLDVLSLRLGMTQEQLHKEYGAPFAQNRNQLTYILQDSSELIVTLRDDIISSVQLKYNKPLQIQDPEMRQLTLVQIGSETNYFNRPTWFFAGRPEDGLIYKVTSEGLVESLTWVAPFSIENNQPKQLQALFQDFQNQNVSRL